jgi:outer membrane protein assembly factor BamB
MDEMNGASKIALGMVVLSLGLPACTCGKSDVTGGSRASSSTKPMQVFEVAPLDTQPRLEGEALEVRAIDEARAVAVTRSAVGQPLRLSMIEAGKPQWSRPIPCSPELAGILDVTTGDGVVVVRCPVGAAVGTMALASGDGAIRWTASSDSPKNMNPTSIRTHRVAGMVVDEDKRGLRARDPKTGALRWSNERAEYVKVAGELVTAMVDGTQRLLDPATGNSVKPLTGRLLNPLDAGVCVFGDEGLVLEGRAETKMLAGPEAIASLNDAGMRPGNWGLRIVCGRRGANTVVLADADAYNFVAVVAPDGAVKTVRLPATAGAPVVAGWERELPRYVAFKVKPRDVLVIDLDDLRIAWTVNVPFPDDVEIMGEMLLLRGRSGDRFVFSNALHLVAVDGTTGDVTADDRALANSFWWTGLPQMIAGDVVWAPGEDGRIEPATFTAEAAMARDWMERRRMR